MLKIVMDTAGDLQPGWKEEYDIELLPINIIHEGKSYLQGIDLDYDGFYDLVEREGVIPSTSQPTPHQFVEFYRKIAGPDDTILSIHVSDKLSGTMNSARIAAKELEGELKIIPFDSASGIIVMGMMCKEARELDRAGKSLEDILARLEFISKNTSIVLALDSMRYAKLSGRIKSIQATIASLLNIKPIVELDDGELSINEKVRTRKASHKRLIENTKARLGSKPIKAAVVHAHDPETAEKFIEQVQAELNCQELAVAEISISVASHFGPGTIGITAYPA